MDTDGKSFFSKIFNYVYYYFRASFADKMQHDLNNKTVVITGACSEIGEALAQIFFDRGCILILIGRDGNRLECIKRSLLSINPHSSHSPILVPFDFSELDNIHMCVEKLVNLCGHFDILVNNANVNFVGEVLNTSLCTDMEIMNINYFSQMAFTKGLLNSMLENRSGHIIFISSSQGICTDPLYSAFGASQHALLCYANSLRDELCGTNIKISTICLPKINPNSPETRNRNIILNRQLCDISKGIPNRTASEVIGAIENERNEIVIEPFYRKFGFFIKEIWPDFYFKFFRSKF